MRPRLAGISAFLAGSVVAAAVSSLGTAAHGGCDGHGTAPVTSSEPSAAAGAAAAKPAGELAADARTQEAIRAVARARDQAELDRALAETRRLSGPDASLLVPQLALFLLSAEDEREGMAPAVIVSRLGISQAQIEAAVAPHLATASPALRRQLENLLGR